MTAVSVYLDVANTPQQVGTLYSHLRKGRQGTSFRYEPEYLSLPTSFALEPAMSLSAGDYAYAHGLPHSFRDASPDRWGRLLIQKALRAQWTSQNQALRTLTELDYLLETSDFTRQGALRFKRLDDTEFQAQGSHVPKVIALPQLLNAALDFDLGYEAIKDSAEWFGLSQTSAKEHEAHIVKAVRQWKGIAKRYGAKADEVRLFAPVFERILQKG